MKKISFVALVVFSVFILNHASANADEKTKAIHPRVPANSNENIQEYPVSVLMRPLPFSSLTCKLQGVGTDYSCYQEYYSASSDKMIFIGNSAAKSFVNRYCSVTFTPQTLPQTSGIQVTVKLKGAKTGTRLQAISCLDTAVDSLKDQSLSVLVSNPDEVNH